MVTSAAVISETISLLQSRGWLSIALDFLQASRDDANLEIIYVDALLQAEAWDLFVRYAGSGASPVDCASFAIMRRHGIETAFTFDRHFKAAGFTVLE